MPRTPSDILYNTYCDSHDELNKARLGVLYARNKSDNQARAAQFALVAATDAFRAAEKAWLFRPTGAGTPRVYTPAQSKASPSKAAS